MKHKRVVIPAFAVAISATGCAVSNPPAATALAPAAAVATAPATAAPVATPSPAKTVYVEPPRRIYVVPQPVQTTTIQALGAGPGIGNSYPINSEGSLINVRVNPSTSSSIVGEVSQDEYVSIDCTQYGDAVTGPWGTTALWDHIDYPYNGYVSDMWVNTASGKPVVGSC
ncbi:MAG TPA: hypothetical protein VHZ96_17780 [Frankiaceae bacterium]|jgi:hypothetical protein|nr:hypothetical protein [Frankiaceae bacterium]